MSILTQVTSAVATLHRAGLVHGELRMENILLSLPSSGGDGAGALAVPSALRHSQLSPLSLVDVGLAGGETGHVPPPLGSDTNDPSTATTAAAAAASRAKGQGHGLQVQGQGQGQGQASAGTAAALFSGRSVPVPRRGLAAALVAAAAITAGVYSSAGSASGTNVLPSPSTPPNLSPGSLTPEVRVKVSLTPRYAHCPTPATGR